MRFLQGRVPRLLVPWPSCPPDCIALTASITCTLSLALAITEGRNSAGAQRRPIPLDSRRNPATLPLRGRGIRGDARALPSADEPEVGTPSTVMQVLKQRTAHALLPKKKRGDPRQQSLFEECPRPPFWQARFYDFNVWTASRSCATCIAIR